MLLVCGHYSCNQFADCLLRHSTVSENFSPATSDLFHIREENMRTLITWCGTNAQVLCCLAHNHITRQKYYVTVHFIGNLADSLCDDGNSSCKRKVKLRAGPPHLRSLWVNKWRVKQRLYSFFFLLPPPSHFFFLCLSTAPASWWEGWNSHSGWTLRWLSARLAAGRERKGEQEVRGLLETPGPQQNTSTRSHSWSPLTDWCVVAWLWASDLSAQLLLPFPIFCFCFFVFLLSIWPRVNFFPNIKKYPETSDSKRFPHRCHPHLLLCVSLPLARLSVAISTLIDGNTLTHFP